MNKQSFVIIAVVVALLSFAGGTYYAKSQSAAPVAPQTPVADVQQPAVPTDKAIPDTTLANTLIRPYSPILGSPEARVTIVEFLDPSCESCRAFFPTVESIMEKYPDDVRLVVRYAPFHQGSAEAVGILEASRKQNLFLPVLGALFGRQEEWAIHGAPDLEKAWGLAAEVGMDVVKGKQDAADPAVMNVINQDMADIQANNVRGTPTFYINGNLLTNFGHQELITAVDAQVAQSK